MTAIEWSLVGLMGASLGVLATALFSGVSRIDRRLDVLDAGLNSRIDALRDGLSADMRSLRDVS